MTWTRISYFCRRHFPVITAAPHLVSRPGLKVKPPTLRHVDRADILATLAMQDCHPSQASQLAHSMKWLPTMVPEVAASTHKHLVGAAVPTSTNLTKREHAPTIN
jgi:hypothetical protein